MVAQETNLDTIANNLANANTVGYKRQGTQFEDLLYQTQRTPGPAGASPTGTQIGSGARVVATTRSFSQGSIQQTGNPLDMAIEGNGFLSVQRTTGEIAYTRDGSLRLDATGRMVNADGLVVEPGITIPPDATAVTVGPDGTVTVTQPSSRGTTTVGQLQLVTFPNAEGLQALGHNLYTSTPASGEPTAGRPGQDGRGTLLQGATEGSNVEVVTEMIGMISTQRAYEINSKVISAADEMLKNATQFQ